MVFRARHENDRFDHSECRECEVTFAGVYSFDQHRIQHVRNELHNVSNGDELMSDFLSLYFTEINGLLVDNSKEEAYRAMLNKAATARSGKA